MTKIKIQIPVSPETVEREITLPCYRKDNVGGFYKIISEERMLFVLCYGTPSCMISSSKLDAKILSGKNYMDCSQEEFERAYEQTLDTFSEIQILHA